MAGMGRRRKHHLHLPERMYLRRGVYFYAPRVGSWINLGRDYGAALSRYAELVGRPVTFNTLGQVFDRYQLEVIPTKSPKTARDQLRQLDALRPVFAHCSPDDVTTQDVYRYVDARGRKTTTLRERSLLSHVYTKAIEWGAASSNPCQGMRLWRPKARDRYVTDAEFAAVRLMARPVVQVVMDLVLLTGLRIGDVLRLTVDAVLPDGLLVRTSKTGKPLLFLWSPDLVGAVDRAKGLRRRVTAIGAAALIPNRDGRAYTVDGFESVWRAIMDRYAAQGGQRFGLHDLRAKSGSDAETAAAAAERLGHTDPAVTARHYRRAPARVHPLRKLPS